MSTPSDRPRDTALEDGDIGHDHTQTPGPDDGAPATRHDLPNGTMVGEYEIDGLLGEGGMGRVYSATHPVIGKRAAVKVLHPRYSANDEVVDRFVQEARAANQIGHPNIVDIFAFGTLAEDGLHYFVMEWLKGEALYDRMHRHPLSREEICTFVTDISHALEAAHEKRIIHRDLKPENVFLHRVKGDDIQIKLLDFGIAKLVTEESRIDRTRTGTMMGTPKYIAPEQARGYSVDYRVDIYSLGVMLFELVARRLPFDADNAMDLIAMHLHDDPPSLREVMPGTPEPLAKIVSEMLSKEAAARPSLAKLRAVLAEVRAMPALTGGETMVGAAVSPASPTVFGAPSRKKSLGLAIGLGLGVVAVGAAVVVMGNSSSNEQQEPPPEQSETHAVKDKPAPAKQPEVVQKVDPPPPRPPDPTEHVEIKLSRAVKGDLLIDGMHRDGGPSWSLQIAAGYHAVEFRPSDGPKVLDSFNLVIGKPENVVIQIPKPQAAPTQPAGIPTQKPPAQKPPAQKPPAQKPPAQKPPAGDGDDLLPMSKGPQR